MRINDKTLKCDCCGNELPTEHFIIHIPDKDVDICGGCFNELRKSFINHLNNLTPEERRLMNEIGVMDEQELLESMDKENPSNEHNVSNKNYGIKADPRTQDMMKKMYSTAMQNTPAKLKEYLDEYIIGQEGAKKTLAVAVYNHYKRAIFDLGVKCGQIDTSKVEAPDEMNRVSVLVIGSTGSGKTYLLKNLAKKLDIPLAICDSSTLTENG